MVSGITVWHSSNIKLYYKCFHGIFMEIIHELSITQFSLGRDQQIINGSWVKKLFEYFHDHLLCIFVGMGGCSIRDYLERMKQLVQFYGQVDEMYRQKTIHALKSKLSVEVCAVIKCILCVLFLYRIWDIVDHLTSRWPII